MSVPLVAAYVAGWAAVVGTFAFCYHRRNQRQGRNQPSDAWFGSLEARDHYYDLVESNAPDSLLKPALLRRAMASIKRMSSLAEEHAALQTLLRSGAIGDDLWSEWQAAKTELDAENREILEEAETFKQGWAEQIMTQAKKMVEHEMEKEMQAKAEQAATEEEKERWRRKQREKAEAATREAVERARADRIREELIRQEEKEKKSRQGKQVAAGKKSKRK